MRPGFGVDDGTDRIGDIGVYLVPNGPVPKIPDRVPDLMFEVISPDKASREPRLHPQAGRVPSPGRPGICHHRSVREKSHRPDIRTGRL